MKFVTCLVSLLFFSASSFEVASRLKTEWNAWKTKNSKVYGTRLEEELRFGVWMANYYKIKEHNSENHRYTLAMNKFGDLTEAEFSNFVNPSGSCLKVHEVNDPTLFKQPEDVHLKVIPSSVDWANTSGIVTPVKNQGSCGSCWAFSATGATESHYAIATGVLNSLSEQELIDCSSAYGNAGCDGGWMDTAFEYIKVNDGLALESAYPYTGTDDGTCQKASFTHYDPIDGFRLVSRDNETALEIAVALGPVSVAVQANQLAFQFYSSGILDGRCGTTVDHGVLVVGYGTDGADKYWNVKNSWGTDWGENGYVRICKDCDKNGAYGECCINCFPSYPTVSATAVKVSAGSSN